SGPTCSLVIGLTCPDPRPNMCRAQTRCSGCDFKRESEEREMKKSAAMAVVIFLAVCAMSNAAVAQKATVLRVVTVKTEDPAAYAQEIEKGRALMKSLGIQATTRVWQARFAGPEA